MLTVPLGVDPRGTDTRVEKVIGSALSDGFGNDSSLIVVGWIFSGSTTCELRDGVLEARSGCSGVKFHSPRWIGKHRRSVLKTSLHPLNLRRSQQHERIDEQSPERRENPYVSAFHGNDEKNQGIVRDLPTRSGPSPSTPIHFCSGKKEGDCPRSQANPEPYANRCRYALNDRDRTRGFRRRVVMHRFHPTRSCIELRALSEKGKPRIGALWL